MAGAWLKVSGSTLPIVSLAEAKRQVNAVDYADDDDALFAFAFVATARLELVDGILGRPLLTQVWQYTTSAPINGPDSPHLRNYPPTTGFLLERAPIQAVTAVEYMTGGAYVAWDPANWTTRRLSSEVTYLRPLNGVAWPKVDQDEAAWRITATLGYGDTPDAVPMPIRHAALMIIAHLHLNREAVTPAGAAGVLAETPMGVEALLAPYRAPSF